LPPLTGPRLDGPRPPVFLRRRFPPPTQMPAHAALAAHRDSDSDGWTRLGPGGPLVRGSDSWILRRNAAAGRERCPGYQSFPSRYNLAHLAPRRIGVYPFLRTQLPGNLEPAGWMTSPSRFLQGSACESRMSTCVKSSMGYGLRHTHWAIAHYIWLVCHWVGTS
jgi:hypothetical protein